MQIRIYAYVNITVCLPTYSAKVKHYSLLWMNENTRTIGKVLHEISTNTSDKYICMYGFQVNLELFENINDKPCAQWSYLYK